MAPVKHEVLKDILTSKMLKIIQYYGFIDSKMLIFLAVQFFGVQGPSYIDNFNDWDNTNIFHCVLHFILCMRRNPQLSDPRGILGLPP